MTELCRAADERARHDCEEREAFRFVTYDKHFPTGVPVQQNGCHVPRILVDIADVGVFLSTEQSEE